MTGLLEWWKVVKGTPYRMGSSGGRSDFSDKPSLFDCSGFVSWAFNKASGGAIKLPAYTDAIASSPLIHAIDSASAQAGDIVLYKFNDGGQPGVRYPHVAIYSGGGQVIQSGGNASNVNSAPVGQLPGATYWRVNDAPPYSSGAPIVAPLPSNPILAPPTILPAGTVVPAPVPVPGGPNVGDSGVAGGPPTLANCTLGDFGCYLNNAILQWKYNWTHWWDTWTGAHAANLLFIVLGVGVVALGVSALIQSGALSK